MRIKNIFIFIGMFLFLLSSVFATPPTAANTDAYITFDDVDLSSSNPLDLTPNNNDGTKGAGTTTGATGILNEAFSFGGTSTAYVDWASGVFNYAKTSSASYSFWIKTTESAFQPIFGTATSANSGMQFDFLNGKLQYTYLTSGSDYIRTLSDSTYNDGNWHHVVLTYDGSVTNTGMKIYVDGSLVSQTRTGGGTLGTLPTTNTFRIGNRIGRSEYLTGDFDELSIFTYELTSAEVTYLYNSGSPTSAQQYDFTPSNPPFISISSTSFSPDPADIDDNIDATVNFNTTASAYVYTKTYINGALDDTDTGTNTLSGTSYTFEAFTVGEHVGNDNLIVGFKLVNSSNTSQVFIDWTNTSTFTVANTAPNSSKAKLNYPNPQTFENLVAECLVEDRDGDSFDILIEVYKNTVLQGTANPATKTLISGNVYKGNTTINLTNTSFNTGDSLQVKCRGYDGSDYGAYSTSPLYTVINELMTTTVSVNDSSPISHNDDFLFSTSSSYATANTSITVDFTLTDIYKNGVFYKNGTLVYANETNIGDSFTFYSYVSSGGRRVSQQKSTTVIISNTAPQVTSAFIDPIPPQDSDNILTYCSITDADRDLINLSYVVYRNGVPLLTGSYSALTNGTYNIDNITNASTSVDDVIVVECSVTDTYASSALNSSTYTILPDNLEVELVSDTSIYVAPTYYARSLDYVVRYNNCSTSGVAYLYVNNVSVRSLSFNCGVSQDYYFNGTYQHSSEENATLKWTMNLTNGSSYSYEKTFLYDLYAPTATINEEQINNGFGGNNNVTVGLVCSDTLYTPLRYVYYINGTLQFNTTYANNYEYNDSITLPDGQTNLSLSCYDLFSSDSDAYSYTAYTKTFALIDEVTGGAFGISNLTYARLWFGDNSTYYDFVNTSTNTVNVTSTEITDLRFVYHLNDGSIITRFIDMQYLPDGTLRICANKDNVPHYEQLFSASSNKPVIIKNQYAECYIAADETKFAYQDSLILRAFTIDSTYYLYTYTDGAQVFLSSLDGSVQSSVNIDVLEFSNEAYNFNVLQSAVSFSETDGGDVKIQYVNAKENNQAIYISITRTDTGEVVFTTSDVSDPNEFYLVFSTSSLSNVDSSTLFKIVFTAEQDDGTTKTLTRYFNNSGSTGILNPTFAAIFAVVLLFFGLSLAVTRVTFSWFGLVILFGAFIILGLTTSEFYIIMLQAVTSIIFIFTLIIMYKSNSETVA